MRKALLYWYSEAKRNLPWRQKISFYRIWVSEIILQQTQVKQGLSYFEQFIKRFPDFQSLANANEKEVLTLWQGLGYYSRAINMHKAAKQILTEFNGTPPQTYSEIKKLKGVGDYTAAAISSIVYNEPYAVVDGNVFRVLSRFFADKTPTTTTAGKKHFVSLANTLLDKTHPGDFNQAMMELGALICTPANPNCLQCPIAKQCKGKDNWKNLPVKSKMIKNRMRHFSYFIIQKNDKFFLHKRGSDDIYKNMYEPPLIETEKDISALLQEVESQWKIRNAKIQLIVDYKKHILTHQTIFYRVFYLSASQKEIKKIFNNGYFLVSETDIKNYPISNIVKKIFSYYKKLSTFEKNLN
ncbi:MAG: A/G-specific adenine glycosylase [Candidatus Zixiibacteriota bacterium]|nr:MAG: A/G-specific adenine glycosylase [candidate division Zixibacteria bacterium]